MPFAWNNADDTSKKDEAATLESSVLKLEQEVEELRCQLDGIGYLLAEHGCDCDCDHHSEEHDEDCVPCLGCRIEALLPKPQKAKPKDLSSNADNDPKQGAVPTPEATSQHVIPSPPLVEAFREGFFGDAAEQEEFKDRRHV